MAQEEKKFLDHENLKQAFTLIKEYVKGNYVSKTDYKSGSATSDQALDNAKNELNTKIDTVKSSVETELTNAKATLESADTTLQSNIDKVETDYKAADATLQTNISKVETDYKASDTELKELIDKLTTALQTNKIKFSIVDELPTIDKADERTIYLVKNEEEDRESDNKNIYIEYIFIDGRFEELGDTQISLDEYSTTEQVEAKDEAVKTAAMSEIASTKTDLQTQVASAKAEALKAAEDAKNDALQAVTELQDSVEENNYVKADSYISSVELQALFAGEPILVDADGNVSTIEDINKALTTAPSGTTIILANDITVPANTQFAYGITIDLNGFTMEVAE